MAERRRPTRTPPHDLEAERAVLGAAIIQPDVLGAIADLDPDAFYARRHGEILATLRAMSADGEAIDAVTVAARLRAAGSDVDPLYVLELVEQVPSVAAAPHYAAIVQRAGTYRRIISITADAQEASFAAGEDGPQAVLADLEGKILDLARGRETTRVVGMTELVAETIERLERGDSDRGIPTGFVDLDGLLGGLHPGNLILVAARPGVGKSAFVTQLARSVALDTNTTTLMFSLEMSRWEVGMRLLCGEAEVPWSRIRAEQVSALDWSALAGAADALYGAPLFVVDQALITMPEIRALARRQRDLGLIVVDYLQLMTGTSRRGANRQEEVSDISRGLKLLAKDLDIPVVAVSQLNRGLEGRADKRPQLSDLRDSGALEQDADIVAFLHRESGDRAARAEIIVAKHRNGPTDTLPLHFHLALTTFAAGTWAERKDLQ